MHSYSQSEVYLAFCSSPVQNVAIFNHLKQFSGCLPDENLKIAKNRLYGRLIFIPVSKTMTWSLTTY